jgi:D-glycero-D-manno-heptose 1,7-bisphosphate phosphatase
MNSLRAVFLDRDGVLNIPEFRNGRSYAPRRLQHFILYPEAPNAVLSLKKAGFMTIVVTNQPDVGAGLLDQSVVEAMHNQLRRTIAIDDIEVCFETQDQATELRKPDIGMLRNSASKWNFDLAQSYLIGDRWSDVQAGLKAGCTTIFIDRGYTKEQLPVEQAATVFSLGEAVSWILQCEKLSPNLGIHHALINS